MKKNNKNFKNIIKIKTINMKKSIQIIKIAMLLVSASISVSCNKDGMGDKVYLEIWRGGYKLHVNKNCHGISKNHMVEFINKENLADTYEKYDFLPLSLCTKCVSDEDADKISTIIRQEKE